jgi:hypothetical protein
MEEQQQQQYSGLKAQTRLARISSHMLSSPQVQFLLPLYPTMSVIRFGPILRCWDLAKFCKILFTHLCVDFICVWEFCDDVSLIYLSHDDLSFYLGIMAACMHAHFFFLFFMKWHFFPSRGCRWEGWRESLQGHEAQLQGLKWQFWGQQVALDNP